MAQAVTTCPVPQLYLADLLKTMATALVESMATLSLEMQPESTELLAVEFKIPGLNTFSLELEPGTEVRDIKKYCKDQCNVQPEHMRLIHKGKELKQSDVIDNEIDEEPIQILFTAGAEALIGGGSQARSGGSTGQPGAVLRGQREVPKDPFRLPVRGPAGFKGNRVSRVSARRGGMGMIRKYDIMMKRQEFREKAEEIGFRKYR